MMASAGRSLLPPGRIHLVQGEQYVTDRPETMVSTLLGSCVAACLRDPVRRVGGMNHFLLPGRPDGGEVDGVRFGVHAMELLVNALLSAGAHRERLEAKLFGGAHVLQGLHDVGRQNSDFALSFLHTEGIRHLGGSLGGATARRVQFWPASGRARQLVSGRDEDLIFVQELRHAPPRPGIARDCGAVELF